MSSVTEKAADLAFAREEKMNQVAALYDEMMSNDIDDNEKYVKSAAYNAAVDELDAMDRKYQTQLARENAERMISRMSREPNRAIPSLAPLAKSGHYARIDSTGSVSSSYGLEDTDPYELRGTVEYRKAFREFISARGDIDRIRSKELQDIIRVAGRGQGLDEREIFLPIRKDMTLGTTTNGSYAAPYDLRPDIITQRTVTPVMSRLVQMISTNTEKVRYPRNLDSGATDQVGTGYGPYAGETPNTTLSQKDTGPFDQLVIDINTKTAYSAVSKDMLEDVTYFESYVTNEGRKAFNAEFDNETMNGVTANLQCEGVLSCASIGITKTGVNNTLVASKVVEAFYAFRSQYSSRLAWVMARPTMGKLVALNDGNNRSLFLPSFEGGLTVGSNGRILSTDVYFNEYTPTSGASLAKSIVVGDWDEYILAMRSGISIIIDPVSWARYNRTLINWRYRFGGAVRDYRAFRIVHETA